MKLRLKLLTLLGKTYEPDHLVHLTFERYDLAIQTDETGRATLLFIGQKGEDGKIKGERFARQPKGHWDNKGKIT